MFGIFLIKKKPKSKNHRFWVFEKYSKSKTPWFRVFQNPIKEKEPVIFLAIM